MPLFIRATQKALYERMAPMRDRLKAIAPYTGPMLFLFGVAFDAITLTRIDRFVDNVLLFAGLLLLGGLLVLEQRVEQGRITTSWVVRRQGWWRGGVQFLLGSLLSAYTVYFFRSSSTLRTGLFMVGLAGLMVINEWWTHWVSGARIRLLLYLSCAFGFFLFAIPIFTGVMGAPAVIGATFLALGAASLVLLLIEANPSGPWTWAQVTRRWLRQGTVWVVVLGVVWVLEWLNVIPPVPLALVDVGTFHRVQRHNNEYQLTYEKPPWYLPLRKHDAAFRLRPGDVVWVYTAIFAPSDLRFQVFHFWEHYDPKQGAWNRIDRIPIAVVGGRGRGFRAYSRKKNVVPGSWRVVIETEHGRVLGVHPVELIPGPHPPPVWVTRQAR